MCLSVTDSKDFKYDTSKEINNFSKKSKCDSINNDLLLNVDIKIPNEKSIIVICSRSVDEFHNVYKKMPEILKGVKHS